MILHLRPDLVKQHQEAKPVLPGNAFKPAHRAWTMPDRSQAGHIGLPAEANARKGEQLLNLFAAGVSDLVDRVVRWNGQTWEG